MTTERGRNMATLAKPTSGLPSPAVAFARAHGLAKRVPANAFACAILHKTVPEALAEALAIGYRLGYLAAVEDLTAGHTAVIVAAPKSDGATAVPIRNMRRL